MDGWIDGWIIISHIIDWSFVVCFVINILLNLILEFGSVFCIHLLNAQKRKIIISVQHLQIGEMDARMYHLSAFHTIRVTYMYLK